MKKKKIILFSILALLVISLCFLTFQNGMDKEYASKNNNDLQLNEEKVNDQTILEGLDEDHIFKIQSQFMLYYEPTIDNLYENSDIVFIGKFLKDVENYSVGTIIHTITNFEIEKILKNSSGLIVADTISFDRLGGIMTVEEFLSGNTDVSIERFSGVTESNANEYYLVQELSDKLVLTNDNTEYMVFLSHRKNNSLKSDLSLSSVYYGIREIKNNKLYDYNSDSYIFHDLVK